METYSRVKYRRHVGGAEDGVLQLLTAGWCELLGKGWASERHADALNWDHQVLWITKDLVFRNGTVALKVEGDGMNSISRAVAALTFSHMEHSKTTWIHLSIVSPTYRRQGLYRALYAELREHAKKAGMLQIQSSTALNNSPMQAVALLLGRKVTSVTLTEELV